MIKVFTLGKPNPRLGEFAKAIFALPEGAYNLPDDRPQHQPLFEKLSALGVRQIVCDGIPNEILCMDGYLFAQKIMDLSSVPEEEILRFKNT